MKTLIYLFVLFIYSSITLAYEVGRIYPVSKTLDFYNPATRKSFRIVKRRNKDIYLKIVKERRAYYKVLVVDRSGKPTYGTKPFFVWKKYFRLGVLKKAVELTISVPQKIEEIVQPSYKKYCAECVKESSRKSKPWNWDTSKIKHYPDNHKTTKKLNKQVGITKSISRPSSNHLCRYFQQFKNAGVPEDALKQALSFYQQNQSKFSSTRGQRYISIADYSQNSRYKRFFILDLKTGNVEKHKVSHGSGSQRGYKYGDPDHDGYLDRCTSPFGRRTNMTRLGFFKTDRLGDSPNHNNKTWKVVGPNGVDHLKLHGLTPGVNDEAYRRSVYMHGAWYNNGTIMGRSYGCPAFRRDEATHILNTLKGGTLYYATTRKRVCQNEMKKVLRQVPNWQQMCE